MWGCRESLDLRLTPYNVIATGTDNGMVEFVPSHTLAAVLEKHKAIAKFLAMQNPDPQGPFGMHKEVRRPTPAPRAPSSFWVSCTRRPSVLFLPFQIRKRGCAY